MATGKEQKGSFDIADVSGGCNYSDDIAALTKNQSPDSMNIEFFNGRIRKRKGELAITTVPTGQGGLDSYNKLMLHMDGTNASQTFTDSETTPKTVTTQGNAQISTLQSKFSGASGYFSGVGIDSPTVLMLHMDGPDSSTTFTDSSASAKTVTPHGTVQIKTAQSKFGGASGLFSIAGDGLSLVASTDWFFDTSDFSIDGWVRFTSIADEQFFFLQRDDSDNQISCELLPTTGRISFFASSSAVTLADYTATGLSFSINTWYHLAIVRRGTNISIFVNGVAATLTTNTAIASNSLPNLSSVFTIGARQIAGSYDLPLLGYLDEFRISKGIARWTSNFNVPLVAYDTTGDYLSLLASADFDFGTGDFTVDFWHYASIVPLDGTGLIGGYTGLGIGWLIAVTDNGHLFIQANGTDQFECTPALPLSTWTHIAVVRSGNILTAYQNGVTVGTLTITGSHTLNTDGNGIVIGRSRTDAYPVNNYFTGYLDEVRIGKGIARWTSDFTPPALPYDVFNSSIVPIGFSVTDFPDTQGRHQQIAHLGTGVYAYDRISNTKITLRGGAPYVRSFNSKASSFLIQTYNDYSIPYYWDGVATSMAILSSNAPNFKRTIEFQGYLLGMNTSANKTRIYYQLIGNIIGGGAAYTDYFTLTPAPSDDEITDSFLLNGRLYCGTKYSIFRVSFVGGVTVFEFKPVISDTGIVPGTVQTVITKQYGQVALFLGTDKRIYMFDGSNTKPISDLFYYHNETTPIALDLIDDNYKENSFSVYDSKVRIYRLFITKKSSSKNYYCMNIDIDTFAYYPFDNMQFSAGCIGYDRLLKPYLVCTDYTGVLHNMFIDYATDNGTAINEYYVSPMVSLKKTGVTKGQNINLEMVPSSDANLVVYDKIDYARAWSFRQNISLKSSRDQTLGTSFVLNSAKLGSDKSLLFPSISINATFNCYQFKLFCDRPTAAAWEVYDIMVDQEVLKMGTAEAQR